MPFKPMLASPITDMSKLKYPLYASIKYDGIRATMQGGKLLSRTLKPIPNENVQAMFKHLPEGIDGELMFGNPSAKDVFQQTTSIVMSHTKSANGIKFYAFDFTYGPTKTMPFSERYAYLRNDGYVSHGYEEVELVQQVLVYDEEALLRLEENALNNGFEGLILRSIDGPYKEGRSTEKQGWLLKLKRFEDAEAKIVGFVEEQENQNEAKKNLLGRTERSTKKEGMVGKGTLGKFEVIGINGTYKDVEFSVGGGLTAEQRDSFWKKRKSLVGKIIKFKYFPVGCVDKPRFPVFLGFRDKKDI